MSVHIIGKDYFYYHQCYQAETKIFCCHNGVKTVPRCRCLRVDLWCGPTIHRRCKNIHNCMVASDLLRINSCIVQEFVLNIEMTHIGLRTLLWKKRKSRLWFQLSS